jgi:ABC-type glycerol-3-phosphate transport system substrate-binding protein
MRKWLAKSIVMLVCISMVAGVSLISCKPTTTIETTAATETTAGSETTAASETQQGKKTLNVVEYFLSDVGNTVQFDMITKVYADFEAKMKCDLNISSYSWSDCNKQLMIMAEGGQLPDVALYGFEFVGPVLVAKGVVENLDPYFAKDSPDLVSDVENRIVMKLNNQIYGFPYTLGNIALYVNGDLLEKNGFTAAPKTWQELRDMALKCTDASKGVYGLALNGGDEESLLCIAPFIAQNGGHVGLFEGKQGINQPASVEAIQFVVDMANKDKSIPGYVSSGFKEAREIFNSGNAAFLIDASWNLKGIMPKNVAFNWYTTTLPAGKQNGSSIAIGDSGYSIFSTSENKELAWEFVKNMTLNEEVLKQIVIARMSYPTVSKKVNEFQIANETYGKYIKAFSDQLKLGNALDIYDEMPNQVADALTIWKDEFQKAVLGEKTVQAAMDSVAAGWDKLNADWSTQFGDKYKKDVIPQDW